MAKLTNAEVKNAQPRADRYELPDGDGLVLRVTSACAKTWVLRFRAEGRSQRKTLGRYPDLSLAEARKRASRDRVKVADGDDPRRRRGEVVTFSEACDRWERDAVEARGVRSAPVTRKYVLKNHVERVLGSQPVTSITRARIVDLLEDLRDRKGLGPQANRVATAISGVFTYCQRKGLRADHPVRGVGKVVRELEPGQDEYEEEHPPLTVDQLAAIWEAADKVSSLAGPLTKLLLLVPLRREEWTRVRWSELRLAGNEPTLELTSKRTKGKRSRTVPLPAAAVEILSAMPRWLDDGFVFSATGGRTPFEGWVRAKRNLAEAAKLDVVWTVHGFRRAVATAMEEDLDVDEATVARLLGHSESARRGVTARYARTKGLARQRAALEGWAAHLLDRVEAPVVRRLAFVRRSA